MKIPEDCNIPEIPLNIVDFVQRPDVLNEQSLSRAQLACLKVLYGLPLDEEELEIYRRASGREDYVPREQREMSVIAGRRSGKSSRVAAPVVCFETFRDHSLPRGEKGYVLLIAPSKAQARICFDFIRRYLQNSPILSKRIAKLRKSEIELSNGITIACCPCSYVSVRGVTIVAAVCDEMAFWRHDETAANPEQEILDALRPGMATVERAKLLKISTPFRKEGILHAEYQRRAELDFPVWQVSTFEMNPAISPVRLETERRREEQTFRREYMAEFSENITAWIDSEDLEACVIRHRTELPRVPNTLYVAAIDPAFVRNDFALAVSHLSGDGTVIMDCVARWSGKEKAPLGFEWVCREIKRILDRYDINSVIGDQYCAAVIRQELGKLGIHYEDFAFVAHTRVEIFGNLKHLLIQRRIELLDDLELLRELRNLEERRTDRGRIDVRPRGRINDDLAIAVALSASELTRGPSGPDPFLMPTGEQYLIPNRGSCVHQAICAKFPFCVDEGICQLQVNERFIE